MRCSTSSPALRESTKASKSSTATRCAITPASRRSCGSRSTGGSAGITASSLDELDLPGGPGRLPRRHVAARARVARAGVLPATAIARDAVAGARRVRHLGRARDPRRALALPAPSRFADRQRSGRGVGVLPRRTGLLDPHAGSRTAAPPRVADRGRGAVTYTAAAVLGLAFAVALDQFVLRTNLLRRKAFWTAYAI